MSTAAFDFTAGCGGSGTKNLELSGHYFKLVIILFNLVSGIEYLFFVTQRLNLSQSIMTPTSFLVSLTLTFTVRAWRFE
jgi:hypothetical protein